MDNTALVLEGGGLRGMYTAGVLDVFLKHQMIFPYCIGVSAGAAYGASYVSKQIGRNREVNRRFTSDSRYLSLKNLIKTGNIFDPQFVYHEIPEKHIPFDFDSFFSAGIRFRIGVTNCLTGKSDFMDGEKLTPMELMDGLAASSSLPFVSKIAHIHHQKYLDGGISNPIPIDQALSDGYQKLVVILTRNQGYYKKEIRQKWLVKTWYRRYPHLVECILKRAEKYNQSLEKIEQLQKEGKIYVIRPQKHIEVSRIEKDTEKLMQLYETACMEAESILPELKRWLDTPSGVLS